MKKKIRIVMSLLAGLAFIGVLAGAASDPTCLDTQGTAAANDKLSVAANRTLKTSEKDVSRDYSTVSAGQAETPVLFSLDNTAAAFSKSLSLHSNTTAGQTGGTYEKTYEQLDELIHSQSRFSYSEQDMTYIARVVYAEARGEIFEGQVAVASVVLNRYESGNFGSTVKRVVFARSQFAVSGKYNEQVMDAVKEAIANRDKYPADMFYFQASTRKTWRNFVYYLRIGGHSFYCAAS